MASLSPEYAQFSPVAVPVESGAESAWIGEIQPFPDDGSARAFLRDIEERRPIFISNGRIREADSSNSHWADPLLLGMNVRCKVLVLVMPAPAHPRSYLLDPFYPEHYTMTHPHPRSDQLIVWDGKRCPGLCIYSAAEFKFAPDRDRNAQYLDQMTLYVARHLVWLRTRRLMRGVPPHGETVRILKPGEAPPSDVPRFIGFSANGKRRVYDYWSGYWPGPVSVAFDAASHLKSIHPDTECWCGSGIAYRACHRRGERAKASSGLYKN